MFEEGARLKSELGAENVFDFSLGNPDLPPPDSFKTALKEATEEDAPHVHSYMPNAGFYTTRKAIARMVSQEQGVSVPLENIIMTTGAGGALNVALKAILDPGDEVIVLSPFFVEYNFYIDNHGGIPVKVETNEDFSLNFDAIEKAIKEKTKAIIINSPNNPTGTVYTESQLKELGHLLEKASSKRGYPIYLLSDEPYRRIVYDGVSVPSVFLSYKNSVIATSFSKDLSIPGERIGYLAVHPLAKASSALVQGMILAVRILGFVNAPALMQRVVEKICGDSVDIDQYRRRRDLLCNGLAEAGYQFIKPKGAFYLFPKSPIPDDTKFVDILRKKRILVVPGSGFGRPGHIRISYCVSEETIRGALPYFKEAIMECRALDRNDDPGKVGR